MKFHLLVLSTLWAISATTVASAQDTAALAGEALLFDDIPSVFGASKYDQRLEEAPASVTLITADEIKKYGYRTLADILRSQRGMYITYDRNYTYLGVRGFSQPTDYNSRVLVMIDGHRTNENIYHMAILRVNWEKKDMTSCPRCVKEGCVKDGIVRGRQRWRCRECGYRHTVQQRGKDATQCQ